ncbi:carcinine hydrolase/isopenicillin-N N-acyltransferase family protein [Phaeobacter inhibens]|uniref:carcinine hydrolase/isopenicillin-N N-acyltransferase family protein n=1 Tax=Phaeobacter inhibens TaxID=221822 RepID=UPI000C9B1423|nr:carcinine hydrolase/isopenicillin-N N-acyltransferase family protein [Phaeobacter inhibens]
MIAYSYDTSATGAGYVVINPVGASRASIVDHSTARWDSRFGSVSFNQMGPGMPTAGMNTAGLFISLMWNDAVRFPAAVDSDIVNELELIQRVLDQAETVEEAVRLVQNASVQAWSRIQYFVADGTGRTAALLPTANGLVVRVDKRMPVRALTNSSYDDLLEALSNYAGFGGTEPLPTRAETPEPSSLERFIFAASASRNSAPVDARDGFAALEAVENSETRWQIVSEPGKGVIVFRLSGSDQQWRIDTAEIDYSCMPTPLAQSLDSLRASDVEIGFQPLDRDQLTETLAGVLEGFSDTIGLPAELARPITMAQINALICID